jgi:carbonic anhydrase
VIDGLVREGRVGIVGMVYDVTTGAVWVVDGTLAGLSEPRQPVIAAAVGTP